jgi:hypothetical protein
MVIEFKTIQMTDYNNTIANFLSPTTEPPLSTIDRIESEFQTETQCLKIDFWFTRVLTEAKLHQARELVKRFS